MSGRRDPLEALAQRWGAAGYLVAILGTEVLTMLVGYLAWSPRGTGAVVQLVVYIVGIAAGILLWRLCPKRAPAGGLLRVFLILTLGLWVLDAGRQLVFGEVLSPLWLTVPLLVAMIWTKPPAASEARAAVSGVALAFATAVVLAVVSEVSGLSRTWYVVMGFEGYQAWDASYYWLPLAELLGFDGRWAGPFLHPNVAGPIGGLLIVVGLCRSGIVRWGLIPMGFLVLALTSSRTSLVGALLGVTAVLVAAAVWERRASVAQWMVLVGTTAAVVVVLTWSIVGVNDGAAEGGSVSVADQVASASGRSEVWSAYAQIWQESPWWGSPDERIGLAALTGQLPNWASTAHNLLLDSLVRLGLFGTTLVVVALVVAGLIALRAAAQGVREGIGLIGVILGCSLTEALIYWRLLSISTIILFLAVIASVGPYPPARWPKRGSSRPDATISAAD